MKKDVPASQRAHRWAPAVATTAPETETETDTPRLPGPLPDLKIDLVLGQAVHAWHKPGINLGIKCQHQVVARSIV